MKVLNLKIHKTGDLEKYMYKFAQKYAFYHRQYKQIDFLLPNESNLYTHKIYLFQIFPLQNFN